MANKLKKEFNFKKVNIQIYEDGTIFWIMPNAKLTEIDELVNYLNCARESRFEYRVKEYNG